VKDACFLLFVMGPIGCSTPVDGAFGIFLAGGDIWVEASSEGCKGKGELDFCTIVVCGGKNKKNLNHEIMTKAFILCTLQQSHTYSPFRKG
jgi:hypothetical protein